MTSSRPPDTSAPQLRVLVIADDPDTLSLAQRTVAATQDELHLATDLSDGLNKAASLLPDLAFVDVTLGNSGGLAVIHHLRAINPNLALCALTRSSHLELGTQAVTLGAEDILVLPLSGDEILSTLTRTRGRHAERADHARVEREAFASRRALKLADAVSQLVSASSRRDASERLANVLLQAGAQRALVYLPADEGSRQLVRLASVGPANHAPTFCEDFDLLAYAHTDQLHVVRLTLERRTAAILLLGASLTQPLIPLLDSLSIIGPQIAIALALVAEREQTSRGAMKDPTSSAYTFAYFVDVAGREIDKARRHNRCFALATLTVAQKDHPNSLLGSTATQVSEAVLSCVRDTDILARVDDTEFYLLLPETTGMGAHACRRRVMQHLLGPGGLRHSGHPDLDAALGIATFPQDGFDLSQLLRVARHRADVTRASPVRRLGLDRLPLPEILDALLWRLGEAGEGLGLNAPQIIELPLMDVLGLATTAVSEASRSGPTRVIASQRSGMSIGAAARAALSNLRDDVTLDVADISTQPAARDLEILVLLSEHGTYALLGRTTTGHLRAIHSADPVLADLLIQRLGEAAGMRWMD